MMKIIAVAPDSQAERLGIKSGDMIDSVNGHRVNDHIDLMFYADDDDIHMVLRRENSEYSVRLEPAEDYGFDIEPMDFRLCGNNCVFCFIDQNPPGMRKGIYVKDEDYRLSFLHGSYVTLTNLRESDIDRIIEQRLSPLYVSVHATETPVRLKLLGIRRDDRLIGNMDRLLDAGIRMHCQIVVCPGINDGAVLERTIHDLRRRHPGVQSTAIVPVGLTKHRGSLPRLEPVSVVLAAETIDLVDDLHSRYARETGDGFVYSADEWYIRAGRDIPEAGYYDDFPQIENGVGMVRDFIDAAEGFEDRYRAGGTLAGRFALVTGTSMESWIAGFAERISAMPGIEARAVAVVNGFYGDTVTVSGLLTGGDIFAALEGNLHDETVVLPPNCLNADGLFLDGMTPVELSDKLGVNVIQGGYDPVEMFVC
jgi:putative radical SAM enzyme (TIGR03279 family)